MSKSHSCTARFAAFEPCIPIIPNSIGWLSGRAPSAFKVNTVGSFPFSTKPLKSSVAPAIPIASTLVYVRSTAAIRTGQTIFQGMMTMERVSIPSRPVSTAIHAPPTLVPKIKAGSASLLPIFARTAISAQTISVTNKQATAPILSSFVTAMTTPARMKYVNLPMAV